MNYSKEDLHLLYFLMMNTDANGKVTIKEFDEIDIPEIEKISIAYLKFKRENPITEPELITHLKNMVVLNHRT